MNPSARWSRSSTSPKATLYAWRREALKAGAVIGSQGAAPEQWPGAAKFAVALETAALPQAELATLQKLGIAPSFSRPGVSDDNAQAEAFFRTLKYRPGYPARGFETLEKARTWIHKFARWYNFKHRHSAIKFVTPAQRHSGEDVAVLLARDLLYQQAKAVWPQRWAGPTRDCSRPEVVWLNLAPDIRKNAVAAA